MMHRLRVRVVDPPATFGEYGEIVLENQTKKRLIPGENRGRDLVFEIRFEMREANDGVVKPFGEAIYRYGDGRSFIYLRWRRVEVPDESFRRIKLYFDQLPGWPELAPVTEVSIFGADKKGEPSCSTARIAPSST